MSAKWRALQHRHRYTYSAVIFPQSYIDSLNQLPSTYSSLKLFTVLRELVSLNSVYAQVSHVKNVASAFGDILLQSSDENLVSEASRFYLEILFLENSLPLHRALVSVLAKTRNFQSVLGTTFRLLCDEYSSFCGRGKKFCVSRVALSMMSSPKLGFLVEIVEECVVSVCLDIVIGLNDLVLETNHWLRPSPIVMEQCQEALSCLYYLLQRFPTQLTDLNGFKSNLIPQDSTIMEMVVTAILSILKSSAFSRDCFVAAGVSFCAAIQVCLKPQEVGIFVLEGIFRQTNCTSVNFCDSDRYLVISKVPYKGDIYYEIRSLSVLSRLCLIRGILTAVSRTVLNTPFSLLRNGLNGSDVQENGDNWVHTILYDEILPELCYYCENPTDSHFNFHTLTVMQICLQQIKTSRFASPAPGYYDPIPEEMGTRILRIIWNNLEDPLSQTVKQVHLIFDLFLDIQATLPWAVGSDETKFFLREIALDLLRLGPRCKGRYVPLSSLTKRVGAKSILNMSPDLLIQTVHAYTDDDVCCAATSFLKCFLELLRDECWNGDGIERGYEIYRGHCLPPILYGLASGVSKLRSNLNTYALPVLLEVDLESIFPMLSFINIGTFRVETEFVDPELRVEQKVAILVSVLKVSRVLALVEGDIDKVDKESAFESENINLYAYMCIKGVKLKIPIEWLLLALTHVDESLRIDTAESLFLNPKTSSLPSHLELSLMRQAVPLNMRCCSTAFQMKWTSLFRKFFSRVKTALERQLKEGSWLPLVKYTEKSISNQAEDLFCFMKWLSQFLFFSCYPSAPYERKIMAMELILIMIDVWSIVSSSNNSHLHPYNRGFTSPDSTLLLVGSIIDSWDRLRESSFRILLHFPNPLPGISNPQMVQKVVIWAKKLVCSPRVRESDAGALSLRLLFKKYVVDLGWIVRISDNVVCCERTFEGKSYSPSIEYIKSVIDWLSFAVEDGEKDLTEACKKSFVHGMLLTLRYTFEELDWNSDVISSSVFEMGKTLEKLLELIMRITSLALWVVSSDAWHLPEDMDDMVVDVSLLTDDVSVDLGPSENEVKNSKISWDVGPSDQIVMVGCWLAMKEVSLLLGSIIRKVPLPSNTCSDLLKFSVDVDAQVDSILNFKQLETIGNHFLEVLLKMKHNGAIDKTRAGFTALCNRLLCSNDPRLCKLTETWMEQLMERTISKGQTVDDLLRRSAGIPAAFTALFLSEPEGTPKKLLPRALKWLISVAAGKPLSYSTQSNFSNDQLSFNKKVSKTRDEGVIPTVHAFNVLKAAFNDANLATDTSGFLAEAFIISVQSFSSPYWEIRNSACLAYTALVRRMIGFLNVQKRESARRALTGLEFFHRYPLLHSFLYNELNIATELLGDGSTDLAKVVHPSLCPVLILLSRLKPSIITSSTEDTLDPFLFMPFIMKCSTQSNLRIRFLASRALTGIVSNEKLPGVILNIASCIEIKLTMMPRASFNSIHGMILQLSSLLDTNCRNLADCYKKDQIIGDLIQVLERCSWIGRPRFCPCPMLNSSFLKVLDHMLSILKTCNSSRNISILRKLLLNLSSDCLDLEVSHRSTYYDPTVSELRKQAKSSYLNCIFQASKEVDEEVVFRIPNRSPPLSLNFNAENGKSSLELPEKLLLSLSDSSYEVRIATLRWLFQFMKSAESTADASDHIKTEVEILHYWAKSNLQVELMNLLAMEKNNKCTCYILKILYTWNLLQFQKLGNEKSTSTVYIGGLNCESVLQFWNKLVILYKLTRHTKTREVIICCMGICVRRFSSLLTPILYNHANSDQFERCAIHLYEFISHFVDLIKKHSDSSEAVNMRKAAAESIIASGLLKEAELFNSFLLKNQIICENSQSYFNPEEAMTIYARDSLDLWFTCIKLLEDEDVDLRRRLAVDVQKCYSSEISVAPTQVEKVIELSFEYLSSIFGNWVQYLDYLSTWVFNAANNDISTGDLVRRVFDKEIDNHHEEKLLICQICCSHIENLPISKNWAASFPEKDGVKTFLLKWRMRFYSQLISFANKNAKGQGGVDWIGGIGNHKDAFPPLYANLLGLYALSNCIFNGESENSEDLLSQVIELGESIKPFLGNPLICNLFLLVVAQHKKMVDALLDDLIPESRGDESIWDGFDPYFLLR